MTNKVKTKPSSLNESTLEANIASEIQSLFNSSIFNFGYSIRLRELFGFQRINYYYFKKRKTKLYRLTPIEENKGGGWDTKISIPKGDNDSRAIFIQFKRGLHNEGNNIPGSIFNTSIKNPNPHAFFKFNDNSNNNQHQSLKNLADELEIKGLTPNSVMYGFPRITELDKFEQLEDGLLLHTTFLTLPEIDEESKIAGANLYDSKVHHFRTCYIDEKKREISSKPFKLNREINIKNIIYELLLVKLSHFRNNHRDLDTFERKYLNYEIFLLLADYLKINPIKYINFEEIFPKTIIEEIKNYFNEVVSQRDRNFNLIFGESNNNNNPFSWRYELFKMIVEFFNEKEQQSVININTDIPSNYSFSLSNESLIEISLKIKNPIRLIVF